MTRFVGLLYSITIGSGKRVLNAPFCELIEGLGHSNPKALLATGNVVFDANSDDARGIEREFEAAFAERFGRHIDFIVRDAAGWARLVAANPFPEQTRTDPSHVAVRVMREPVTAAARKLLEERASAEEIVRFVDGDPWVYFAGGIGTSRLAGVMTPKRAGVGTSRNFNTVKKIADAL
ncbi:DUF1697 domain-containing protein [Pelagibacterium luteolum]|uniref:Uncharacterized conserved protein, DUF1697 family n=1 Tax=Pelagibacterium luteolum TaxID=440168 RepID=A0A1G7UFC9_9HYPH|nr:DUF1697 domain-containing protein [Pelagibacterium luteolum]SDG46306.1 Uncharacterized conserved protein, DUF1697 family [Pelagibacterium luteolum]